MGFSGKKQQADEGLPEGALSQTFVLSNKLGLHIRPAAMLADAVRKYSAKVEIRKGKSHSDATSIMGLLSLAAGPGATLEVVVTGEQATEAMKAVEKLFNRNFEE